MKISEAKTHVIDGVTYVEVDRNAEVGDKVLVFNTDICEVIDDWKIHGQTVYKLKRPCGKELQSWFDEECLRVLESLEETPDINDLLANLARRVEYLERKATSLEQQLRDTHGNCEKLAEELATVNFVLNTPVPWATQEDVIDLNGQIRRIHADICELDERTQPQSVEVVTFEKFLDSIADKVAERLVGGR